MYIYIYIYMKQYKYKTPASNQYIVGGLCANNVIGLQAAIYVCIYYRRSSTSDIMHVCTGLLTDQIVRVYESCVLLVECTSGVNCNMCCGCTM
jgi:hypothetical protein